jgi:FG-GAP-like repeat/ASPIC and UnbV
MPRNSSGRTSGQLLVSLSIGAAIVIAAGAGVWWWVQRKPADAGGAAASSVAAEFRAVADRLYSSPNGVFDRGAPDSIRRSMDAAGNDMRKKGPLWTELVQALLRVDRTEEAIAEVERLFGVLRSMPGFLQREKAPHYLRGLAYLRLAEIQNCVARHNDECCVFPLKGGGVHSEKSPAEQAVVSFTDYLAIDPEALQIRWLLNIAYMALGKHPDGVPPKHLIPDRVPGAADFPRFPDIAAECGITKRNHAGGCIVDDLDGDGVLDIFLSSLLPDAPLTFYRGKGDGTFEDVAARALLKEQWGGLNLVATDYDGDGDLDVHVLRGGWLMDDGRIRKSLLRNEGNGTFTDVTHASGLAAVAPTPSQTAAWFDYDNDGDLDVYVGNESRVDPTLGKTEFSPKSDYPGNLFRNEGNGTFTDVAKQAGVTNDRYAKGVAAGDYDNDGWTDLYVSNIGKNRLYRNKGDGTFEDVAPKLGMTEPAGRSFATWFFDFDNDGNLDVWCGGYDTDPGDIAAWMLGKPFNSSPPRLYRNKGDGTFEDVTRMAELWRPIAPMGANFGDLDNDGWLDVYLSTGAPQYEAISPHVMLRNVKGRHFTDVSVAGGFAHLQKGHGVAFADLDCDGDQDVFNENGGLYEGDSFYNSLYENPGNSNRFLTLKLEGKKSNRLAYGARIKVVVKTPAGERAVHRAVGSVSSFGGSPARQEIGLGDASAIDHVEIWWPATGTRQKLGGLELDAFYSVVEGEAVPKKLAPKRFKLGGK